MLPLRLSCAALVLAFAAISIGPATAESKRGSGWLESEREIEAAISDATHVRTRADGTDEVEFHSEDGRVAYAFEGCLWSGEWWIAEEAICYRYPSLSGDMAHCFYLRDGPAGLEYWSVDDQEARQPLALVKSLLQGNPRDLSLESTGRCRET
ncbi:MAG: hypothetical protein Kilf2KO_27520 [Rhodospirillales bacterium]